MTSNIGWEVSLMKTANNIHFNMKGNEAFLELRKTAFLCSRKCPGNVILRAYDWAVEQRDKGMCVISGFHSKIEKDVLHYLLKGSQSVILVLARSMLKRFPPALKEALAENRLLILSPFDNRVKRPTRETALKRNKLMLNLAEEAVIAYASEGGGLERLILEMTDTNKIQTFDQATSVRLGIDIFK